MRVMDRISMTSPSGLLFVGKWVGGEITGSKKVAVFEYPGVNGASTQDHGVNSSKLPLDFWFDDQNHSITARNFLAALSEKGEWSIVHPVHGAMKVQPTEFTIDDQPVKSANCTSVKSQWVIAVPKSDQTPYPLTVQSIREGAVDIMNRSGDDLSLMVLNSRYVSGIKAFISSVANTVRAIIKKTYDVAQSVIAKVEAKFNEIITILAAPFLVIGALVKALVAIYIMVGDAIESVKTKIEMFRQIGRDLRKFAQDTIKNVKATLAQAQSYKMMAVVGVMALCSAVTTGKVLSRDEAIQGAEEVWKEYVESVETDDAFVEAVQGELMKTSYQGNLDFGDLSNIVGRTTGMMISGEYSSAIKRVITLKENVATLNFAIEAYPDLEIDDAYEYLIDTNGFYGDRIVMIPAGVGVVVYI